MSSRRKVAMQEKINRPVLRPLGQLVELLDAGNKLNVSLHDECASLQTVTFFQSIYLVSVSFSLYFFMFFVVAFV